MNDINSGPQTVLLKISRFLVSLGRTSLLLGLIVIGSLHARAADGLLTVTPAMLSGPLVFFSSAPIAGFAAPIPYGIANNVNDAGWIWPQDNSGYLQVDFTTNTPLSRVRAFVTYGGGARGVIWTISYSDDGTSFTPLFDYT
ncbi:MAG: discoidin domain-containing protein, partial [Verrucomicrobiota bacterium]